MSQLTPQTGHERRIEPRYRVNRPGVLKSRTDGVIAILVLDLSASGLRVSLPCRLPLDAKVEIEFEDAVLSGWVRHCQCIGAAAFNLGIWAPPSVAGEQAIVIPDHLRVLQGEGVLV